MAEPQLSVRSAKACDLARRENGTIAEVVQRALESYEMREAGREPAPLFYARLAVQSGADIDIEAIIRQNRRLHKGALILLHTGSVRHGSDAALP